MAMKVLGARGVNWLRWATMLHRQGKATFLKAALASAVASIGVQPIALAAPYAPVKYEDRTETHLALERLEHEDVAPYVQHAAITDTSAWLGFGGMLTMFRAPAQLCNIVISASQINVNLTTEATNLGFDVSKKLRVVLLVKSGVFISSLHWTAFVANSTVTIINNGYIVGGGGNAGPIGHNGGGAIGLSNDVTINNTNGVIGGGGGGGGTGAATYQGMISACQGGGGGGGAGLVTLPNTGGLGGGPSGGGNAGGTGQNGNKNGFGFGASGGHDSFYGTNGGAGGNGGALGQDGQAGANGADGSVGQAGGLAGPAIAKNGHVISWLGGNNSSQVLGAVA